MRLKKQTSIPNYPHYIDVEADLNIHDRVPQFSYCGNGWSLVVYRGLRSQTHEQSTSPGKDKSNKNISQSWRMTWKKPEITYKKRRRRKTAKTLLSHSDWTIGVGRYQELLSLRMVCWQSHDASLNPPDHLFFVLPNWLHLCHELLKATV